MAKKGEKLSQETKDKLSIALKGRKHTKKTKDKISKSNSKPIVQLSLNGEFIKRWDSFSQVKRELNLNRGSLYGCCKGKHKTCGGYKWMYLQDYYDL